jgi:iron-sulfur cluster assembly accessory protein
MYETELVEAPEADDEVFELNGVTVFIPRKDLPILNGTEIDFITVGLNSMLQFRNPNVTGECGCGESFSVTEES